MRTWRRPLAVSAVLSAAFVALLLAARPRWAALPAGRPATCLPDSCFCERPRPEPFRQPADTWSNVAYVTAGGLLLGTGEVQAAAFGLLCVLLGAGSAWFHGTLTFSGEWLDVWTMFVIVGFLTARNLRRLGLVGAPGQALAFAALSGLGALVETSLPGRVPPFAAAVVLYVISERRTWPAAAAGEKRRFLAALGFFLAALGIWCLDRSGVACAPESLWQGHALWHVLCAVSLGLLGWTAPLAPCPLDPAQ